MAAVGALAASSAAVLCSSAQPKRTVEHSKTMEKPRVLSVRLTEQPPSTRIIASIPETLSSNAKSGHIRAEFLQGESSGLAKFDDLLFFGVHSPRNGRNLWRDLDWNCLDSMPVPMQQITLSHVHTADIDRP